MEQILPPGSEQQRTLPWAQIVRIYERDSYTCRYCGFPAAPDLETWWQGSLQVDHIKPRRKGGENNDDNLVTSCRSCNLAKSGKSFDSFEAAKEHVLKYRDTVGRDYYKKHVEATRGKWGR